MDTNNYNINQRDLGSLDRGTKCAGVLGNDITLSLYFQWMEEAIWFSCTITVGARMIQVYKNKKKRRKRNRFSHEAGNLFLIGPQQLEHANWAYSLITCNVWEVPLVSGWRGYCHFSEEDWDLERSIAHGLTANKCQVRI